MSDRTPAASEKEGQGEWWRSGTVTWLATGRCP